MSARIERLVTAGTFSLDGGTWDVDNNVWIVGDERSVYVIDPAHDAGAIAAAVGTRTVKAVLLTHGHDDHIRYAREFATLVEAPVLMNSADQMLWEDIYPGTTPDGAIVDGERFEIAGTTLTALHTPGHSPAPCASTRRIWAPFFPETPCSTVAQVPRDGPTATSPRSLPQSPNGC